MAPSFLVEILLLATFALVCPSSRPAVPPHTPHFFLLLSLLTTAMGIQAATLRRVGQQRVTTTFVSGMLISMVEEIVAWVFVRRDAADPAEIRHHAAHAVLFSGIFGAFIGGAVLGSACEVQWGPHALALPIAALLFVVADDYRRSLRPRT